MPKGGVSPAFMRNGVMELLYPVACLVVFTVTLSGIITGLGWSLL